MSEYDLVLGKATPARSVVNNVYQANDDKILEKLAGIEKAVQIISENIPKPKSITVSLLEYDLMKGNVMVKDGMLIRKSTTEEKEMNPIKTIVESGIDAEKKAWFAEIGMTKLDKPYSYYCVINDKFMHYSEEYLINTPLNELKMKHSQNKIQFEEIAKIDEHYVKKIAQDIHCILLDNTEFSRGENTKTENERIAVLEYKVDEMQGQMKAIKNGFDTLEKMLKEIANNPFGLKS